MTRKKPRPPANSPPDPDLSHIIEPFRAFAVATSSLKFDPDNARLHPDGQIATLKESLKTFGQDEVLIYRNEDRRVVHGNGRLMAARELILDGDLRWTKIAAVGLDEDVETAIARGLAHNVTPETGGWDQDELAKLVKRIQDAKIKTSAVGLSDDRVASLLARLSGPPAPKATPTTKRFSVDVPREEYARLTTFLESFHADRSVAFGQWLAQSLKKRRNRE